MLKLTTFQITLLAVFGSLGIAGMLTFALATANGGNSTIGPVVIWGTFDEPAIRTILREAADSDTRFAAVTYVKKDAATYESLLTEALANGRGPDLFFMRQDHAVSDANFALHIPYTSLSQSQFNDTFLDAASPYLASDGVVAVPIMADPLVLFWNKDALATVGIAEPPQYWDQVPEMVKKLVKKSETGTIEKGGIALGEYQNISSAKAILTTMILQAGGAITELDASGVLRPLLATKGGLTVAVTALKFFTEFADPSQEDYSWSRAFVDARASFAAGDVAMYVGHASEKKNIASANPNLNIGVAQLPQIRSATYATASSDVYGISIARTSKNARGALTIAYLIAAPAVATPIAKTLNMSSALRRVLSIESNAKSTTGDTTGALQNVVGNAPRTGDSLLSYEANISRSWLDPDPDKTGKMFRVMIEETVSGASTASEAVQRGEKQLAEILNI